MAPLAVAATIVVWSFEWGAGHPLLAEGFTIILSVITAVLVIAWLMVGHERRMLRHLQRIEGERYRDGYAAGYLDAAARFRDGGHYERPSLRPVK